MLTNYFKIAYRNLFRNKIFSFINIFGLATGIATCLLIMLYILDETSYDKHYKDADRIYRISSAVKTEAWAAQPAPLAKALKNDFPEAEEVTRLLKASQMDKMLLKNEQSAIKREFYETNGYYVDANFFKVFDYDFKYGDPAKALTDPNTVIVSELIAEKLFGDEDPIGRQIKIGLPFGEFNYTVKGVFKNQPFRSHIPAHLFLSMENNDVGNWIKNMTNWATNSLFYTYVKLYKGSDPGLFERKLQPFLDRNGGKDLKAAGFTRRLFIQPLQSIYLHSDMPNEISPTGSSTYLYILGSIAAFILLIACINFMNLATARSGKRAREVGVRKVIGAGRSGLVQQFLGESFMMCLLALVLAIAFAWFFLPVFNQLTQKDLHAFSSPELIIWIAGLTLFTGLLSGLYPAFYLSSFKPVSVLKGRILNSFSAVAIRKGLVIFQFTISICLVLGAIVIWQQLDFLKGRNLGFNKDQQIVLPLQSNNAAKNYSVLKDELLEDPLVKSVTSGSGYPGLSDVLSSMLFYPEGKTVSEAISIDLSTVENDYFKTLGLNILYGRAFSKEFTADSASIILNETAVRELGYHPETAVGKELSYDYLGKHVTLNIVGIVKDFNYKSLHNKIEPFGFTTSFFGNKYSYLIANVNTTDYSKVLAGFEKSWNEINPGEPFSFSFIDQDFQKNYEKEQRTSHIVVYFTCIAILIACLGLFGLAAFSAEQRTREIGIRKVLGATVMNITTLLSKDFLKLVIVSILIATPAALWGMQKWLQNFAYRIDIQWWMFVSAGVLAMLIALITVSFQAIKTALMNPVKSLRSE